MLWMNTKSKKCFAFKIHSFFQCTCSLSCTVDNINAPTVLGNNSMAVSLMHCNQVKSVLELTAFTFICPTVLAFLRAGAASVPYATGASGAASTPLAEAVVSAPCFFLTSRQVTWFAPFPTTFVHLATYKAKNTF